MNRREAPNQELIVFVNEQGEPTGETGPKLESHHRRTRLHLAFSCYVFNDADDLLVTRRADSKKVWPGVWTNSFCGHPMPGEPMESAIHRRANFELGVLVGGLVCIVPDYKYKTPAFNGIIENEFCPIYVARARSQVKPNPEEVGSVMWMPWEDYRRDMEQNPDSYSYWAKDQLPRVARHIEVFMNNKPE